MCKNKSVKQAIYERALKNCPKVWQFVCGYLRELEKNEFNGETI